MAQNKVEICGVNTGKLKVMKESEKLELLKRVKQGDRAARDALVFGNLKLVLSVIQRFLNRNELPDDLFQVGCIGLIKAIDNFDCSHGVRFSTYAVPMIIGELRRFLRDNNSVRVSRSLRDTAYKAMQVREQLQKSELREPSISAVAKELGIEVSEVVLALESVVEPVSMYEPLYSDGADTVFVFDSICCKTDCEQDWLYEISFRDALHSLGERERQILSMRFMGGLTQTQVARRIGISQAQVSRLEKNSLERIRQGG